MEETQNTILVKLRTRMNDLLRMGILTPDGAGMYQQTVLQLLQEFDRRKATCLEQAEHFRRQAAAADAQAAAFGVCGSVLFSVVNGYINLEEKRIIEEQEAKARETSTEEPTPEAPKKNKGGRPKKKVSDPAGDAPASTSGAGSDAPNEG